MSVAGHTFGATCQLAQTVSFTGLKGEQDVPPLKAQFFYDYLLPLDDPLAAKPGPSGSDSKSAKRPPRPFDACDNEALEEAWLGLASEQDRRHHRKLKNSPSKSLTKAESDRRASVVKDIAVKHNRKHANEEFARNAGACKKCEHPPQDCTCHRDKDGSCAACPPTSAAPSVSSSLANRGEAEIKAHQSVEAAGTLGLVKSGQAEVEDHQIVEGPEAPALAIREGTELEAPFETPQSIESNATSGLAANEGEAQHARKILEAQDNTSHPHHEAATHVLKGSAIPICCAELVRDVKAEQRSGFTGILRRWEGRAEQEQLMRDVMAEAMRQRASAHPSKGVEAKTPVKRIGQFAGDSTDETVAPFVSGDATEEINSTSPPTFWSHLHNAMAAEEGSQEHPTHEEHASSRSHQESETHRIAHKASQTLATSESEQSNPRTLLGNSDIGTTGSPFQRVPSHTSNQRPESLSPEPVTHEDVPTDLNADDQFAPYPEGIRAPRLDVHQAYMHMHHVHHCKSHTKGHELAEVPVGRNRLHLVKLPLLQMMPIYWSQTHDSAAVTRGTWFYKDTMFPVEPVVANQLELGYRELRPWSRTWNDELNSAIEVGAAGEEKISHRLWPAETEQNIGGRAPPERPLMAIDPYCAARCFHGEVAAVGTVSPEKPSDQISHATKSVKIYPHSHVIYKDALNAFILKPNLQPSEYYGRRPLAKIRKNITVGVHVVRGFDWRVWARAHPPKKSAVTVRAGQVPPVSSSTSAQPNLVCAACCREQERPKITDLILVIHGIGQKLSERVESFRFTHAINSFRRSVDVELANDAVQRVLRPDFGGAMVLPINWRSSLSFEGGGPMESDDKTKRQGVANEFTLKDITPDTIPAVRNLISDVMLDIPFYMSHHKPRMIQALIMEANRVYRLWCKNNPSFQVEGRVHIIAHSLGSAMALEILSKQPTFVPSIDLHRSKISKKHFEFDTRNLFFVGSPAGFFLLLHKGKLIARKARTKPGAHQADGSSKDITGEIGTFGCIAADNLYNVMHYNDPIAYRLNAAVDPMYAKSLKNAQVPSATVGLMQSLGNAVRSLAPGATSTTELAVGSIPKPTVARLPSQLEMEIHDFTREEIAEKKLYLLNDNGQIDYFLSSGGGPLEIQYLNMLSAHSSYWGSADFIRMLVTEVGRKPGRSNTLPNMRAVKVGHK
ncbi:MAG: hypothetical protein M1818_001844 [Claussenomyces sp. TS43310]|nr:MAG: hypothetical protein M1818_001844 [Claussenomyces sp. TS43310]